ncbi:MAG TPA: diguanylate cyclase [Thermoanaerobaculia bacterium]|nr:diguanylate cyclase [Thermoanaerobaculia bacterium]
MKAIGAGERHVLNNRRRFESTPATPSTRVLVVDDDENVRVALTVLLGRIGCDVETAEDGEQAMEMLSGGSFDIALCDLDMPKVNGLDLIERVRECPASRNIYAVMITVHAEVGSRIEALARGYDDFVTKGCPEVEVVAKISAARRMLIRQRAVASQLMTWRDMATRDQLTNVATRRTFFEQAAAEVEASRNIAIAIFDLDDFKRINDTFGHLTGDRVLHDVGAVLLSFTREYDLVARLGGDEFVVMLRNISVEDAVTVSDRLAADIGRLQWTVGGADPFSISSAVGVGHASLLEHPTVEQLLGAADRHLYARKWLHKHPTQTRQECYEYPAKSITSNLVLLVEKRPETGSDRPRAATT